MVCTCGKGDEASAICHADDCPCIDWIFGSLEGDVRSSTKGGSMAEGIDFNEEEATRGGEEIEEDPVVAAGHREKENDPDTLANPTELQQGGGGDSPGLHDGGNAAD